MGRNTGLPDALRHLRITAGTAQETWPDDTGCGVLHIDMDAFFAAVELRTRPELVEEPVIVAGSGDRSVVLSANYPAREFGVRSAMPVAAARRLCPHAVYLTPTRGAYGEISTAVMAVFAEFTPLVEPLSLDEAFLDVGGALKRLRTTPASIGAEIRARIAAEHGITCSVGIAPVKFAAKLASSMAKPDAMVVVPRDQVREFLHPLPVSALSGVGQRTNAALERAGLRTIADVAATPLARLRRVVGTAAGEHLHALANGADPRPVEPDSPDKSLGAEQTFSVDQDDHDVLIRVLLGLSERVAATLRAKKLGGKTVVVKIRFANFTTITRSRSLPAATDVAHEIQACAQALLIANVPPGSLVRLLGVRVEGLSTRESGQQLRLDADEPRWRDAELAADTARDRFGTSAVRPASLLGWSSTDQARAGADHGKADTSR